MQALLVLIVAWFAALLPSTQQNKAKAEFFARADGSAVRAAVRIKIQPGWHLYGEELGNDSAIGLPTKLEFSGDAVRWGAPRFPKPEKADQPFGKDGSPTWIYEHHGTIVIYVAGELAKDAKLDGVALKITGLTCEDAGSCVPYEQTPALETPGPDNVFTSFPSDLKFASAPAAQVATTPEDNFEVLENPKANAKVELFTRAEGSEVRAVLRIAIKINWHIYHETLGPADAVGKPTVIALGGSGITWGNVVWPDPLKLDQPVGLDNKPTWIFGHKGTITLFARGKLDDGADGAKANVSVSGAVCTDAGKCDLFDTRVKSSGRGADDLFAKFPASAIVDSVAPTASKGSASTNPAASSPNDASVDWNCVKFDGYQARETATQRSLGVWLFFAFIAGILLNVMPCVLPVLSIKVLSFVQQAGESKGRVLTLGLAFSAGIMIVFIVLAALAAFAGQGWGAQFQNETFKIVVVAIVFAFSLSLFDVYELGVPSQVGEFAAIKREGVADAFFKGIMATVLATPCSGPFLGSTLAWALSQTALTVFAVFIMVGLGMASPYVLLTANPKLLKFLPKPGAWMQTFKQSMGFVLLGTVVFLMVSVRQDNLLFVVAMLVFVGIGCWWWGKFATFERTTFQRLRTLAVAFAIVAVGAWLSFGWLRGALRDQGTVAWEDFDPAALERYHAEGRPVMLDFTADWCFNCKTNEVFVYESKRIADLLEHKHVVAMKADKSHGSPKTDAITRFHKQLGSESIPFMAIFMPGAEWQKPYVFRDLVTKSEVAGVLEKFPDAKDSQH